MPSGALRFNRVTSGDEANDNAALNEELWHLVGLMTLKPTPGAFLHVGPWDFYVLVV